MSDLEAIQNVLTRAARRRRSQRAWNGFWHGLFFGAIVWLIALATYKLAPIPLSILVGAAALAALFMAGGFLRGWFTKSTLEQTARCVDDRQRLQERMSSALELAHGGNETWRALLVADAARFAAKLDPRKVFPYHLPGITRWALVVLVLGASLGFLPEHRSKDYIEKKQDAAAIKDIGRRIVEITHRSLEQRPPVLEATHKTLEAVEQTRLKLDKYMLTRNDALKDLANVAEKLKSQINSLGEKNPEFKDLEKAGREATPGKNSSNATEQRQLEAAQNSLEKSGEKAMALDKMNSQMQKMQQAMSALSKDHSAAADSARQQMAQQAAAMGEPLPNIDDAIAALKANKADDFQHDMEAATTDMEKAAQMAKTLQQMQSQSDKTGRDLAEQLKFGQADAAQQTLQKMIDKLNSAGLTPEQMQKMLDEVTRGVDPASSYGKAAEFLKQASHQMKSGDKSSAAQSLASASKELEKISQQMSDAKSLQDSLDAVNNAEMALAKHQAFGQCQHCGDCTGRCMAAGHCLHLGDHPGSGGVGTWTDDDSQLYPKMSGLWDNSGANRPDQQGRGMTDRGDPRLADNLAPTKLHGQIAPGSPMPSITLKGVSIKGQSGVSYQEAVSAAQSDAQSALNQDQVPRAYQGTVKDYFDDLKK